MSDRAVSTVLDVSVSLLLVGVAVLTLLSTPTPGSDPASGRAEEVATTIAGTTATVRYEASGGTRTVHGTHAGLLADAAVSNRTPASGRRLRSAVAEATRPVLGGSGWRAQVVATWRPFEGADDAARVRVGRGPPDGVDLHAATMSVPSGLATVGETARVAAERRGFPGVAAVLADGLPRTTADRRSASDAQSAFTTALEESFDAPAAAARAVSVGRVHVTVRTWST